MNDLVEAIRAATSPDASDETKSAGANACRMILAALEAQAGEPLVAAVPVATPIQMAVGALRGLPPEQLLDLAIAKLRATLPADAAPSIAPLKFQIIPISSLAAARSTDRG